MNINKIILSQANSLGRYIDQLRSYFKILHVHEISVKSINLDNDVYTVVFEIQPSQYLYNNIYDKLDQFKNNLMNLFKLQNIDIISLILNITNKNILIEIKYTMIKKEYDKGYYEIQEFINYYNYTNLTIKDLLVIKSLRIEYTNITKIPDSIGLISNLVKLRLNDNKIIEIPNTIGNLVKLEKLYLSNNKIKELPDSICNLINLKELHLNNNEIEYLPDSIGNLTKLEQLVMDNNKLKELPESIGNLINLKFLFLKNNNITYLPDTMHNLTNLSVISLRYNNIKLLPKYIIDVMDLESLK